MKTTTSPLILASASIYRKQLLERLGVPFSVVVPDIDETPLPAEEPAAVTVRLAEGKARAVAAANPRALIIGSDQVAEFAGEVVGKPKDRDHALAMLRRMQGQTIVFHTAVVLLNAATGHLQTALVDVSTTFRTLDETGLAAYVDRDQPYDCAGAMRVETLGILLCTRVASDDPTAMIGLPLIRLTDMLLAEGVRLL